MNTRHLHALAGLVGHQHLLTGDVLHPLLTDWRGRYHGTALCAVRPADTQEVAAVVSYCHQHALPVVPQGGNTGLCGGASPQHPQSVLICLSRLKRIRAIDPVNNTLTLEAGLTLSEAQTAAEAVDRFFPLSLACEGSCQIGGNLATNAGGVQVLRYGSMRQLTLGLEVVLPNGDIWDGLRGLRKDNAGYDLKHLFIGAEGTLGIITAAVLSLFPRPKQHITVWLDIPTAEAGIRLLSRCQNYLFAELTSFELISATSLELVLAHIPDTRSPTNQPGPWSVLCEFSSLDSGSEALPDKVEHLLHAALTENLITEAVIARSTQQAKALWKLRENISEAQKREGFSIKHDISLPISSIPAFLSSMEAELNTAYPGIRIVTFGHAGDGNLHYNLSHPAHLADQGQAFLQHQDDLNRRVHDQVSRYHGSIAAEHGLGQLKREEILRYKSETEMRLMRAIKTALDPDGLMNPGKVI